MLREKRKWGGGNMEDFDKVGFEDSIIVGQEF